MTNANLLSLLYIFLRCFKRELLKQSEEATDLVNFYGEGRFGQDWLTNIFRVREKVINQVKHPKLILLVLL